METLLSPATSQPRSGGLREMLAISAPMVVSCACDTVMTFTDRLFLARLGPHLMSAAMAGGLTCFMLTTFFVGLMGYTTALVAQYLGAGRKVMCAVATVQALILCLVAYPIIFACRPLAHLLFDHSGIGPEQLVPQKVYFDILLGGAWIGLVRTCLSGFFSGLGRTRVVMVSAMVSMVTNVAANYILIFGKMGFPALGIAGAAYGTIIGGVCGLAALAGAFFAPATRREFAVMRALRYDRAVMGRLLRFGYPAGVELFLNLLAFDALILAFHAEGVAAATATTIVFNWDMVSFVPLLGIHIGVTSLVGRYMGAQDPDTAHRAAMSGLRLAWGYASCTLLAFALGAEFLVGVFRPHGDAGMFAEAQPMAVFMLRLAALYVLADATSLVFSGALRGAGDTLWAMIISVGLHWALVAAVVVMLRLLHLPVVHAWVALCLLVLVFSALFYLRYRSGKWRNIQVVRSPDESQPLVTDGLHETPDL
jgi:MATE family multidrug resistance protein